jgi:hypothetical protein
VRIRCSRVFFIFHFYFSKQGFVVVMGSLDMFRFTGCEINGHFGEAVNVVLVMPGSGNCRRRRAECIALGHGVGQPGM